MEGVTEASDDEDSFVEDEPSQVRGSVGLCVAWYAGLAWLALHCLKLKEPSACKLYFLR